MDSELVKQLYPLEMEKRGVYLLEDPYYRGWVKGGLAGDKGTGDFGGRFGMYLTHTPYSINVLGWDVVARGDPGITTKPRSRMVIREEQLHEELEKRSRGRSREWFRITQEEAKEALRAVRKGNDGTLYTCNAMECTKEVGRGDGKGFINQRVRRNPNRTVKASNVSTTRSGIIFR